MTGAENGESVTAVIQEQSKFGHTFSFLAADIVAEKYFVGGGGGFNL
jgi:hypothetical protein